MRASPTIWTNMRPDNEKQTYFTNTDSQAIERCHLGGGGRDKRNPPGGGRGKHDPP